MHSVELTPLKIIGLFGLVAVSFVLSMSAAFAVGPGDSQSLLISLAFLLVTVPLVYFAVRWTKPGWVRWVFVRSSWPCRWLSAYKWSRFKSSDISPKSMGTTRAWLR